MKLKGNLCLFVAAFLWGITFVAQLSGMEEIGPFTYGMGRYIVGVASLLIVWLAFKSRRESAKQQGTYFSGWKAGLGAGCIMFVASAFQQCAMLYTTAGKTAFITCLYIVFVPLMSVAIGRVIKKENWLGAIVALTGLYLLSIKGDFDLNFGDFLAIINSIFWTFHILFIDHFAEKADNIEISLSQLFVCMVLNTVFAFAFESVSMLGLLHAAMPILFAGVLSSGVAFTLQIIGQKYAEASHAAIIMSLESVFGALGGWMILGEQMSGPEVIGCVLMLAGMLITQAGIIFKRRN